jgi:hypothetical protein
MNQKDYTEIIVESFIPEKTNGLHGKVHIQPLLNQLPFEVDMHVQYSKELSLDYPVGTKFCIKAKITSKEGDKSFVSSHYTWSYKVLKKN